MAKHTIPRSPDSIEAFLSIVIDLKYYHSSLMLHLFSVAQPDNFFISHRVFLHVHVNQIKHVDGLL
jgi:hypothetical protein